ncbi:hypothetical protein AF332_22020 [Sporosarcina globispora]|uniref:Lipoprotein n=1 Tax=Sporosarcina globispora TaxID=1459 RepID=A0A0M0GIA1_SPOGL|nr:hypothetical protein [Sporosarcina globispora]KON89217.1 hypothetical protein AF332_22020 [Sporosarcina globispora]
MKSQKYIILLLVFFVLAACQKDLPEPETKMDADSIRNVEAASAIPAPVAESGNKDPFFVRHQVKGRDIFVECIVQDVSFRKHSSKEKGKILLYINGKKKDEIHSAAFIVKGLPSGKHRIGLELIKGNNAKASSKKEFIVLIP